MRCAQEGRRYNIPFRIEPERGKLPENSLESSKSKGSNVFHDDETRSYFANKTRELSPKSASVAVNSNGKRIGFADVLAGKASADEVNGNAICRQASTGKRFNIVVDRDIRPMLSEDCAAIRFDFTEGHRAHSCSLQSEAEAADA
jgi:hypothetical protein